MKLYAELHGLSSDLHDLHNLSFETGEDFSIPIVAQIGTRGSPGSDLFYFTVASPSRIQEMAANGPVFVRHVLLTASFNKSLLDVCVRKICDESSGDDWKEIAGKLGRYFQWEYEDYQE